ncbi:MAG: hypothetical protein ABFS12_13065 [Bacteroidota bacterium]
MQDKIITILLVLLIISTFATKEVKAQENDSLYHINFDLGLGPAIYFHGMNYENLYGSYPFVFTFRFMWEPEHLLRLGIESGYLPLFYLETKFYDTVFGSTVAELSLNSVPIMAVFAMEVVENFEIIGGIGGFLLISEVFSFDNYVLSTSWSNAYELGLSYLYPISKDLKLGGEVKSYYLSKLENYNLVFHVSLKYLLFSY